MKSDFNAVWVHSVRLVGCFPNVQGSLWRGIGVKISSLGNWEDISCVSWWSGGETFGKSVYQVERCGASNSRQNWRLSPNTCDMGLIHHSVYSTPTGSQIQCSSFLFWHQSQGGWPCRFLYQLVSSYTQTMGNVGVGSTKYMGEARRIIPHSSLHHMASWHGCYLLYASIIGLTFLLWV